MRSQSPSTVSVSHAAPGALYVNTPNNNGTYSGPVTIASDARFRVVNAAARMNFANTVLGNNVALWCTAGNAAGDTATMISFLNTFSIGGGTLTKDGEGIVAFNSVNNTCGKHYHQRWHGAGKRCAERGEPSRSIRVRAGWLGNECRAGVSPLPDAASLRAVPASGNADLE